jgi:nicotinate-nucleotide adenylyltransferase
MRIGVFGGEFDPPHLGHQAVVRTARDQLALDRLLVVPTGQPPHRDASPTPAEDRLQMAQLAFAAEPGVEVSRIELDREGPSYTVDTLRALAPLGDLVLIVGADQCDLRTWREPDEILRLASLAVAPRGGYVCAAGVNVTELAMAPVDLSSTTVRRRLAEGVGEDAVDPAVLALIRARGLYGRPPC